MRNNSDTIVARATAQGQSAVGLIRISGPDSFKIADGLSNVKISSIKSHFSRLRKIRDEQGEIDEALVTKFDGPNSFTGEDVVELAIHGSDFIAQKVIKLILARGARLAEPGEFTMRAYLNGKMDLAQAEAIADLISSQTENEHRLAINQMQGSVSGKIRDFRTQILDFAALIELELDFGEEDVEFADRSRLKQMVNQLVAAVEELLGTFQSGNAIKEGIPVAIIGKPNAGKSTLLNALLGEERAIVTDIPGTTRDTIEEVRIIEGLRYRFIDTAGIRDSENIIEKIGIERTFSSLEKAMLVWIIYDKNETGATELEEMYQLIQPKTNAQVWVIRNKADLNQSIADLSFLVKQYSISAKTGQIEELVEGLKEFGRTLIAGAGDTTISNLRHFAVLNSVKILLTKVVEALDQKLSGDMLAHHLREAMAELGSITGEIDNEEVLGTIFSKFCIGK